MVAPLSLLRVDLVLEGADIAFYPLDRGLESLLSLAMAHFTRVTLMYRSPFQIMPENVDVSDVRRCLRSRAGWRRGIRQ